MAPNEWELSNLLPNKTSQTGQTVACSFLQLHSHLPAYLLKYLAYHAYPAHTEVLKSTLKYPKVPKNTQKYPKVPKSTFNYPKTLKF